MTKVSDTLQADGLGKADCQGNTQPEFHSFSGHLVAFICHRIDLSKS
jgi:hypothetical protein